MESADTPPQKSWISLIDESVHTSDDMDIGDIEAVSRDFIVVKRGFMNIHYYYIPIEKVEGWDGNVLWLKVTEDTVKKNYERDIMPDPSRYYIKDSPVYAATYPELRQISPKYSKHKQVITEKPKTKSLQDYRCDLCNTSFGSEDKLSNHVMSDH